MNLIEQLEDENLRNEILKKSSEDYNKLLKKFGVKNEPTRGAND